MSIHASKGLEFPVVVLADLGRQINLSDLGRPIQFDPELGLALRFVDPASGAGEETMATRTLSRRQHNRVVAEEMRLLYVAMTRAREKLILTGSAEFARLAGLGRRLPAGDGRAPFLADLKAPLEWLAAALADEAGPQALAEVLTDGRDLDRPIGPIDLHVVSGQTQGGWPIPGSGRLDRRAVGEFIRTLEAAPAGGGAPSGAGDAAELVRRLDWRYPRGALCRMPVKYSVTELARRADLASPERDPADEADGRLAEGSGFAALGSRASAAIERGLAWHRFMEKLDLSSRPTAAAVRRQAAALVEAGELTAGEAATIDPGQVERFFASEPGQLMLAAGAEVHRELPFTLAVPARELPGGSEAGRRTVLVQGILDVLVRGPGGWAIIDYKTNRVGPAELDALAEHYRPQLSLYRRAVVRVLSCESPAVWVYFTELSRAVRLY